MKNRIEHLEIQNFKSLKHVKFNCKRVNVFIGKPNVGKSNVLEALSLYIAPYGNHGKKMLEDYLRYESVKNLFYDQDRAKSIFVKSNLGFVSLRFHMNSINKYDITIGHEIKLLERINEHEGNRLVDYKNIFDSYLQEIARNSTIDMAIIPFYNWLTEEGKLFDDNLIDLGYNTPIKNYHFKPLQKPPSHFTLFLSPPFGENLYSILEANPKFFEEYAETFNEYGLDLVLDVEDEKLNIQKRVGKRVYKIPYSLTADTLQRYIFYNLAIETNKDSILLFEEPEAHCFPPYISEFAMKVLDSKTNQFFITTHSPFVLNTLIENGKDEVGVFVLEYKDYQTKIRELSEEEVSDMLNYGYDIFSNIHVE